MASNRCLLAACVLAASLAGSAAFAQWSAVEIRRISQRFTEAVWTGERFVLTGDQRALATSPDGREWTFSSVDISVHALALGQGRLVAANRSGQVRYSDDGLDWNPGTVGSFATFDGVAWGNGLWVAVGRNTSFTSTDGAVWTDRSNPATPAFAAAAFGNGVFVALGQNFSSISTDGETWQSHEVPEFAGEAPAVLAFHGGRFLAATSERVFVSSDGVQWQEVMAGLTSPIQDFGYSRGRFLAVSDYVNEPGWLMLYSSADGETWRGQAIEYSLRHWVAAIAGNEEGFVIAGNEKIWRSDLSAPARRLETVAFGNDRFVAFGSGGRLLTSPDGSEWVELVAPAVDTLWDLIFAGGHFVSVGSHGTLLTSPDGESWTPQASGTDRFLRSAIYGNGRFVTVGGNLTIRYSDDLVVWKPARLGENEKRETFQGVTFGNGIFVAVGQDGVIFRSLDGDIWKRMSQDRVDSLNSVAYGNGRFVAVSMAGLVLVSTNGEEWLQYPITPWTSLSRVRFMDGLFVATGWEGEILHSPNGITWTIEETGHDRLITDVASGAGRLVAVGSPGAIYEAPAFPAIQQQPTDQTVVAGNPAAISVVAAPLAGLSYQWHRDGQLILGETEASIHFSQGVKLADAGLYQVAIGDGIRTIWSMPAELTVEGDYLDWLAESSYTAEELEKPELAGPLSDPGHYSIPNVLRYAFDLDVHAPEREKLPLLEVRPAWNYGEKGDRLVLNLPRWRGEGEIDFSIEQSSNLTNWTTLPLSEFQLVREGNRSLLILDNPAVPSSAPSGFYRVKAEPTVP